MKLPGRSHVEECADKLGDVTSALSNSPLSVVPTSFSVIAEANGYWKAKGEQTNGSRFS